MLKHKIVLRVYCICALKCVGRCSSDLAAPARYGSQQPPHHYHQPACCNQQRQHRCHHHHHLPLTDAVCLNAGLEGNFSLPRARPHPARSSLDPTSTRPEQNILQLFYLGVEWLVIGTRWRVLETDPPLLRQATTTTPTPKLQPIAESIIAESLARSLRLNWQKGHHSYCTHLDSHSLSLKS